MCSRTDPVDGLHSALDAIAGADPAGLPAAALRERLLELRRASQRLAGQLARHLAVFDAQGLADADACPTTAAWCRRFLRAEAGEAAELVRQARTVRELPGLGAALDDGTIGVRQVATVGRLIRQTNLGVVTGAADFLVDQARTLTPDDFVRLCQAIRYRFDADSADRDDAQAHDLRYLTTSVLHGSVLIEGRLDPAGGAVFLAALDAATPAPVDGDDRGAGHRRADALVDLCHRALTTAALPTKGGLRPQVLLQITPDALRADPTAPQATLHGVGLVGAGTARALACDSHVMRLVLDPDNRQPTELGRSVRTAPESLRKLLIARDGGCVFPGCGRPPDWCDAHHLTPWWNGGETSADNCCLLCRYHHMKVDSHGWRLSRDPATGDWQARPPDRTHRRRPAA